MAELINIGSFFNTNTFDKKLAESGVKVKSLSDKFDKMVKDIKSLNTAMQGQTATQSTVNKSIQKANQNTKSLSALEKERIKVQKQLSQTMAKSLSANEKNTKSLIKGKEALKQKNQVLRNAAKIQQLNTVEGQKLNKTLQQQRAEMKKLQGRGGGLVSSLKSMATGFLGVTALIYGAFRAIKDAVSISVSFEKQMDKVSAITGATAEDMKLLSDNAKELGGTTTQTATQVGQLQEEFAKLGFSTDEILAATEATISLAEASQSDLANSAVVAASTLRGFGLEAEETQRVVDVMAKSFSSSSLDMEKFSTAMATVAPAARASGVSIEETTALLGTMTNAGIDASTAGTSLRNIFIENAKSGRTLQESLDLINNSTNKNTTAFELFGKRGMGAALVLASDFNDTIKLTDTLMNESEGAAQEMADTMRDNLAGDVTILRSAWEGFILSMEDGGGVFNKIMRAIVQALTRVLVVASKFKDQFVSGFNELSENSKAFRVGLSLLGNAVKLNFQLMGKSIKLVLEPLKLLAKLIGAALKGNFSEMKDIVKDSFGSMKDTVVDMKDNVVDAGVRIKEAFTGESIDKFKIGTKEAAETMSDYNKVLSFTTEKTNELGESEEDLEKKRKAAESARKERVKKALDQIEYETDQKLLAEKKKLLAAKVTEEASQDFALNTLQIYIESLQAQLDVSELTAEEKLAIETRLADAQIDLQKLTNERAIELEKDQTEKIEEEENKRKAFVEERNALLMETANAVFDLGSSLRESELQQIEEQEAYKLSLVGDNEEAQTAIKLEADKKRAELKRKQAISDKAQALFNAAINTAIAITSALTIPPPAGPILAVLNGILGGIQIAAIAAKPIPKFAKGTKGLPSDTLAEFGEAGREIVSEPGKTPYIAEKRTIDLLPKGTEIIPNYETEKILAGQGGITEEQLNKIVGAVKGKKTEVINYSTNITERGFEREVRKNNTRTRLISRYEHR